MVQIKQRIVPKHLQSKVTFEGTNQRKTLTVHQTGNTSKGANAEMHARLQERGNPRQASWHIQSDDKEIIQSFPFTAQTWHASDGRGQGNLHSISWEICINSDGNYLKSLEVAAKGIAKVLKDEGLTVADLRQHYDWSQKNCPAQIRAGKDGVNWNKFKQMVQKAYDGGTVSKPVKPSVSARPDANLTFNQVVDKTIAGHYGSQPHRENNIRTRTNFSYEEIQEEVNKRLLGKVPSKPKPKPAPKPAPKRKSVDELIAEVNAGKHGNGDARKKSLGDRYNEVQSEIDRREAAKNKPKAKTLHLPRTASTWRIYKPGGPYVANSSGQIATRLSPAKYGGLSYVIKGNPMAHVYLIDTRDFGRVAIYAGPETGATIK